MIQIVVSLVFAFGSAAVFALGVIVGRMERELGPHGALGAQLYCFVWGLALLAFAVIAAVAKRH